MLIQVLPESRRVVLAQDLTVDVHGWHYEIPNGFQSDGASIPRILWPIVGSPFAPEVLLAAVLHDFLYRGGGGAHGGRAGADFLFRWMLRSAGVGIVRSWLMWSGVRCFGWMFYGKIGR